MGESMWLAFSFFFTFFFSFIMWAFKKIGVPGYHGFLWEISPLARTFFFLLKGFFFLSPSYLLC